MEVDQSSADNRCHRGAVHRAPVKRRVSASGLRAVYIKHPLEIGIQKGYIRVRVLFQRTTIGEPEDARRVRRAHLHHTLEVDDAGVHEVKRQANRSFETGDSKRSLVKLERLFVEVMR